MDIKKKLLAVGSIVGGIAVLAIGQGLGKVGGRYAADSYQRSSAKSSVEELASEMSYMIELKKVDPARYEQMIAEMRAQIDKATTRQEAKANMMKYSAALFADYRQAAPKASDAAVLNNVEARLKMLQVLKDIDPNACGQMAATGPFPGLPEDTAFQKAMENATVMTIRAGHEGLTNPVQRSEPSDKVYGRWAALMLQGGITQGEMAQLGEGKLHSMSPDRQCAVGINIYKQALAIKGPSGVKLASALLVE